MKRLERIEAAVGDELAVDRDEQLRLVLRLIEGRDQCRCGEVLDPFERVCLDCGRATFSPYARPAERAAGVPLTPETLERADFG